MSGTPMQAFGDLKVNEDRNLALQADRKQAGLAPLWLNVMAIKIQLNEFDSEFLNAMIQAEISAKGHSKAVYRLAKIGIQAWPNLSSPQKSKILMMIGLSISQNNKGALKLKILLNRHGLLPVVCYYSRFSDIQTYDLCY